MSGSKFILWGCAGHAKVLSELIELIGGAVVALFDNRDVQSVLKGVPVFHGEAGFQEWFDLVGRGGFFWGAAAIGGNGGRDRLKIHELFSAYGVEVASLYHPTASVSPSASLGEGVQIFAHAVVSAEAVLGPGCIINHRASVDHECTLERGVHVAPGATLCGCVSVGSNTFIGAGAVVLPRLSIGADAVIGAGAVVTSNVPSGATVVGNPARPLGGRSTVF